MVEYGREFQARAAEELARLPEGSAIEEMLADYVVMRGQMRARDKPSLGSHRTTARAPESQQLIARLAR